MTKPNFQDAYKVHRGAAREVFGGVSGSGHRYPTRRSNPEGGARPDYFPYEQLFHCAPRPALCDCNVIGVTTIGDAVVGAGATVTLTLDAGDMDQFIPYYMFMSAAVAADADTIDPSGGIRVLTVPILLLDSHSGRQANLIRGGSAATDAGSGIYSQAYGENKELTCVDWRKFGSQNNQQLELDLLNINNGIDVHMFVTIWGLPTKKLACETICARELGQPVKPSDYPAVP